MIQPRTHDHEALFGVMEKYTSILILFIPDLNSTPLRIKYPELINLGLGLGK